VSSIALAAPVVEPPPDLQRRIMQAARSESRAPDSIGRRTRRWFEWVPSPAALALAACALIAFGTSTLFNFQLRGELAAQSAEIAQLRRAPPPMAPPVDEYGAAGGGIPGGGLSIAGAQMRRLVGSESAPSARAWLYLSPTESDALLVAYQLPALEGGRVYQTWLVSNGQRVSGGIFRVDGEGYGWLKVRTPESFGAYQRVGITIEPDGGSPGPTGARVLGGDL
jgi:anti-sigma-K factor RskA